MVGLTFDELLSAESMTTLLVWVVLLEAALTLAFLAAVFVHGYWLWKEKRKNEPLLRRALEILWKAIEPERGIQTINTEESSFLSKLPLLLQIEMATRLMPSLDPAHRRTLQVVAGRVGLIAKAEKACHSALWWRRLHAVRVLTLLGGGEGTVPLLFQDSSPAVRAEAAVWAVDHATPTVLFKLLLMLSDGSPICRFTAQDSLLRVGQPAIEPLGAYLSEVDPRANRAAGLAVAIGLAEPRFLPAAMHAAWDPSPAVRTVAMTLLGSIGGEEAISLLSAKLIDDHPAVRATAARVLGRLAHWPAAGAIALLLSDPSWTVRRQAALALRALGPPGFMLLRRYLRSSDPFAADMARQALDLPGLTADILTA